MTIRIFNILLATSLTLLFACSKSRSGDFHPKVIVKPVDSTALTPLSSDWKKVTQLMVDFPTGVQVFLNKKAISSKPTLLYSVIFDPKLVELKPVVSATNKKVSDFYAEETAKSFACLNGGFFGANISYSLSMYNGVIGATNIKSLNRPFNTVSTPYYPTRAAFGLTSDGTASVNWVYHVGSGNGQIYTYPSPSPNMLGLTPQNQPSSTFPAGAILWDVNAAIGGSPMLVKDNTIKITADEELIEVDNNSSRARSAIGFTANGKIILLAAEGNNANGATGLTIAELAQVMKDMGCIGAINLDGGGSTAMVINGKQTVKPSDTSGERGVITALIVKSK